MIRAAFAVLALAVSFSASLTNAATIPSPRPKVESKEIGAAKTMILVEGKVSQVSHAVPKCGPPAPGADPCTNVTLIDVEFTVGCLDSLVVTNTASFNRRANKIIVEVTALQMANPKSRVVMCTRANVKHALIEVKTDLPMVTADDVEVRFQKSFANVK